MNISPSSFCGRRLLLLCSLLATSASAGRKNTRAPGTLSTIGDVLAAGGLLSNAPEEIPIAWSEEGRLRVLREQIYHLIPEAIREQWLPLQKFNELWEHNDKVRNAVTSSLLATENEFYGLHLPWDIVVPDWTGRAQFDQHFGVKHILEEIIVALEDLDNLDMNLIDLAECEAEYHIMMRPIRKDVHQAAAAGKVAHQAAAAGQQASIIRADLERAERAKLLNKNFTIANLRLAVMGGSDESGTTSKVGERVQQLWERIWRQEFENNLKVWGVAVGDGSHSDKHGIPIKTPLKHRS